MREFRLFPGYEMYTWDRARTDQKTCKRNWIIGTKSFTHLYLFIKEYQRLWKLLRKAIGHQPLAQVESLAASFKCLYVNLSTAQTFRFPTLWILCEANAPILHLQMVPRKCWLRGLTTQFENIKQYNLPNMGIKDDENNNVGITKKRKWWFFAPSSL